MRSRSRSPQLIATRAKAAPAQQGASSKAAARPRHNR
jgi:hypothetical protein